MTFGGIRSPSCRLRQCDMVGRQLMLLPRKPFIVRSKLHRNTKGQSGVKRNEGAQTTNVGHSGRRPAQMVGCRPGYSAAAHRPVSAKRTAQ